MIMMKVLLVEDSELLRESLTERLNELELLEIKDCAETRTDAIDLLEHNTYDMIIADIELAEGTGFDVIRFTQSDRYPHHLPIYVMLTNHANNHYRRLAKQLGVHYFYDKSMDFDAAIDSIRLEAAAFY